MIAWGADTAFARHFRLHGRRLGCASLRAYDESARETVEIGTYFEYRDPESAEWRIGYYDRFRRRLTALTDDGLTILSHFRCSERYVAETLPGSTYS
jgi:hypothetical protein